MNIPGLDKIMSNMDKFVEMTPVLEDIRDNLDKLVKIQLWQMKNTPPYHTDLSIERDELLEEL